MKRSLSIFGVVAIALTAPASAAAKPGPPTSSHRDQCCMSTGEAPHDATSARLEYRRDEIVRQDARLNQAYKMVMARLGAAQKQTLRLSEREWIVDRDRRCETEVADEENESSGLLVMAECFIDATIRRTAWLEHYRPHVER